MVIKVELFPPSDPQGVYLIYNSCFKGCVLTEILRTTVDIVDRKNLPLIFVSSIYIELQFSRSLFDHFFPMNSYESHNSNFNIYILKYLQ